MTQLAGVQHLAITSLDYFSYHPFIYLHVALMLRKLRKEAQEGTINLSYESRKVYASKIQYTHKLQRIPLSEHTKRISLGKTITLIYP